MQKEKMSAYSTGNQLLEFYFRESRSAYIGQIRSNTQGELYKVLGNLDLRDNADIHRYFLIEFLSDKTRVVANSCNISLNNIKNPYTPNVISVGFTGQGVYSCKCFYKEYNTWKGMLARCYGKVQQNAYIGCTVDERWFNFQNFCEDIQYLEGYKEWKENTIPKAWQLDKDIRVKGNKVYSKDTCKFVTLQENTRKGNRDLSKSIEAGKTGKTYLAINTDSKETFKFDNMSKFARDHNLSQGGISGCISGHLTHYSNWEFKTL